MKRLTLSATILTLALPATAAAAGSSRGVVLSVNQSRHAVELVDANHVVHTFTVHGALTGVRAGSVISFRRTGAGITAVRNAGSTRSVSYYARVVHSSGKKVVLRLADGRTVSFAGRQLKKHARKHTKRAARVHKALAHAASAGSGVTINIEGLAPGTTVLVSETTAPDGSITISITLPPAGSTGTTGTVAGDQSASGVVSDVGNDTFTMTTSDGSSLVFHMAADALSSVDMFPCDTVTVSYHNDSGLLVADNVDDTGTSDTGDCSGDDSSSDEVGPIVSISPTSVTIATSDQGNMTFAVDPTAGLTDGYLVGDVVDVTYAADGSGTNVASDIEYVENDVTGTVSAVSAGSITVVDGDTGKAVTFNADPAEQLFDGVAVGDTVDVTSHQAGSLPVVDNVDDLTADGSSAGGGSGN